MREREAVEEAERTEKERERKKKDRQRIKNGAMKEEKNRAARAAS